MRWVRIGLVLALASVWVPAIGARPGWAAPGLPSGFRVQRVNSPTPRVQGNFGVAFVNAGDVNGDGKDDLLVGSDEHGVTPGQVFLMSGADGSLIREIPAPDPSTGGNATAFGSYVGKIADIGSCPGFTGSPGETCTASEVGAPDGVPDQLVTALGVDIGGQTDMGRGYVIDGATGAVLKRIDMPPADRALQASIPAKPAFGRTILSPAGLSPCAGNGGIGPCDPVAEAVRIGDMDGGGMPDIVIGASDFYERGPETNPACDPGPCLQAGRAYVYRGEDIAGSDPSSTLQAAHLTIKNPTAQTDDPDTPVNTNRESMGYSVAPVGDVGRCTADPGPGATCVNADSSNTPDGRADVVISSHRTDMFGMFDVGVAYLVDGPTGSILYTYTHPEPQPASIFAFANYNQPAVGDVGNTSAPDVYLPAMRQNNPYTGGGRGFVMNGNFKQSGSPNSISFATLNDPTPHASEDFGTSSAGIGDVSGDFHKEILVGAYGPHNPGTNRSVVNDVHVFDVQSEQEILNIPDPDQQPGSGFGTAVTPLGDLNGDGFLDFAVGAGLYDLTLPDGTPLADAGRIYIFRSRASEPTSRITRPRDGGSYSQEALTELQGTASTRGSSVSEVQVSLRQRRADGTCRWWDGSRFVPGGCAERLWVAASGTTSWAYDLPGGLARSVGTAIGRYTLFSRAVDEAGATEAAFEQGRNRNTFDVT